MNQARVNFLGKVVSKLPFQPILSLYRTIRTESLGEEHINGCSPPVFNIEQHHDQLEYFDEAAS
jgi:hypothetical protein